MKNILLLGAGLSSSSLIRYLLQHAEEENWFIKIVDQNKKLVLKKIGDSKYAKAMNFDALNPKKREAEIEKSDIVISMLPMRFHVEVAKDCIKYGKNLITPSYVSKEMKALHEEAVKAGVLIMNEIGLDPGIDHLSAMKIIDKIREKNGEILHFESFTGGLVAPESDDNPWNYKFTWNPRNVVLAGQGGAAQFLQNGQYKYIPYHRLFRRTQIIDIKGYGRFEGYANRDSLQYRSIYQLDNIPSILRGTLRRIGFSRAWDVFVQLGATDDSYIMEGSENMTNRDFINSFLPYSYGDSVELKLRFYLKIDLDDTLWDKLEWLGIFDDTKKTGLKNATPAQMLQKILESKWKLKPQDKDMIVMYHRMVYSMDGELYQITSEMVNIGEDQTYTSMSNTVGLPIGICAKMILNGTIDAKGVQLPIDKNTYEPILKELKQHGIKFKERKRKTPKIFSDLETWK